MSIASLRNEVITVQLGRIANYVGSDIVDLVSLCYISELDQLVVKNLTLPAGLTAYGYDIAIEEMAQSFRVQAYLISESEVLGEYILPWSTESNIKVYNGSYAEVESDLYERYSLIADTLVYSGDPRIGVWCVKTGDQITIGLWTTELDET
jgi:hypothetical protein